MLPSSMRVYKYPVVRQTTINLLAPFDKPNKSGMPPILRRQLGKQRFDIASVR